MLLRNINLELLFLLTFHDIDEDSIKVQVVSDELNTLTEGLKRYLLRESVLSNITRTLKWVNIITAEIPYHPLLLKPFNMLKKTIANQITKYDFFDIHKTASIIDWINMLDNWNILVSNTPVQYPTKLEELHRNYDSFDYWRLVFLLESNQREFIEKAINPNIFNNFSVTITKRVNGLKMGLNITKGKPKTHEKWYPLYLEIDDLIKKMKKLGIGKQVIGKYFLEDWEEVKKYGEFAKNRHSGMVQSGYWKTPFKRLRNFSSITNLNN